MKKLLPFFLPFIFITALSAQSLKSLHWHRERLAPGLIWKYTHTERFFNAKQSINILKINTKKRKLSLAFVTDTLLRTSDLANKENALAAINAGFFKIKEGRGSATYLRVNGVTIDNLPTQGHDLLNGALIIGKDSHLTIEYAQPNDVYNTYQNDETILVTGPVILLDGIEQPLTNKAFNKDRHPRTSVCLVNEHRALLITVDGRHEQAKGMSIYELTDLLRSLHCKAAINLDGGGSTTMWIKGKFGHGVVNFPSDNKKFDHFGERPCANAITVH